MKTPRSHKSPSAESEEIPCEFQNYMNENDDFDILHNCESSKLKSIESSPQTPLSVSSNPRKVCMMPFSRPNLEQIAEEDSFQFDHEHNDTLIRSGLCNFGQSLIREDDPESLRLQSNLHKSSASFVKKDKENANTDSEKRTQISEFISKIVLEKPQAELLPIESQTELRSRNERFLFKGERKEQIVSDKIKRESDSLNIKTIKGTSMKHLSKSVVQPNFAQTYTRINASILNRANNFDQNYLENLHKLKVQKNQVYQSIQSKISQIIIKQKENNSKQISQMEFKSLTFLGNEFKRGVIKKENRSVHLTDIPKRKVKQLKDSKKSKNWLRNENQKTEYDFWRKKDNPVLQHNSKSIDVKTHNQSIQPIENQKENSFSQSGNFPKVKSRANTPWHVKDHKIKNVSTVDKINEPFQTKEVQNDQKLKFLPNRFFEFAKRKPALMFKNSQNVPKKSLPSKIIKCIYKENSQTTNLPFQKSPISKPLIFVSQKDKIHGSFPVLKSINSQLAPENFNENNFGISNQKLSQSPNLFFKNFFGKLRNKNGESNCCFGNLSKSPNFIFRKPESTQTLNDNVLVKKPDLVKVFFTTNNFYKSQHE